jgi:long-chain acyl-CoA synthetase
VLSLNEAGEIASLVHRSAAAYGGRTALVYKSHRWSFSELSRTVNAFAKHIASQVSPGDRVAIVAASSDLAAIGILAAMAARAVAVPLHPDVPAPRLRLILKECAAALTIADSVSDVAACGWAGPIRPLERVGPPTTPVPTEARPPEPDDIAVILYTSGSTRSPRGVVCPHRQLAFGIEATNRIVGNTCDDVILSARPLSFVYGLHQLFLALASGATLVVAGNLSMGTVFPKLVAQERVTGLPLVPSAVAGLLQSGVLQRAALPSLRYVTSTGDSLAPAHVGALRRALPGLSVFPMYGLTECGRAAVLPSWMLDGHESSVGFPLPGTSVRILKTDGTLAGPNEEGELRVRGPQRVKRLLEKRRADARAISSRPGHRRA